MSRRAWQFRRSLPKELPPRPVSRPGIGSCRSMLSREESLMKKRIFLILIAVAAPAIVCSSLAFSGAADRPTASPRKPIADFTLQDIDHHDVSLSQFKDRKAVVVVFVGTECP